MDFTTLGLMEIRRQRLQIELTRSGRPNHDVTDETLVNSRIEPLGTLSVRKGGSIEWPGTTCQVTLDGVQGRGLLPWRQPSSKVSEDWAGMRRTVGTVRVFHSRVSGPCS